MSVKKFVSAVSILGIVFLLSFSAFSQGTTTRITGTVTDSSGAAVPGASVTLTDEATNVSIKTTTSNSGNYLFDLIQPGTYTVRVEKEGFKTFQSTRNSVVVNIPATINAAMEVGEVSAIVSVEGTASPVQTATSGNVGTTIETRTLEALPIVGTRGRNPFDLLNYQPGVVNGANTGGGVHVHGSRDRAFNFTLDGIDINESTAGGSNFTPLRPNPDSVREVQITTSNFTAELGRSSGAQVTLTTRSGTNDFSGNLFEYYQTPRFHANEWEFNKQGIAKRQFVQHIYGGSIGGPLFNPGFGDGGGGFNLLKDRAFFFVNLQFLRASETRLATPLVYTPTARAGLFRYVQGGRNAPAGTNVSGTFPTGAAVNADGSPRYPNCGPGVSNPCIATYDIATGRPITVDPFIAQLLGNLPAPNDYTVGDGLNTGRFNFVAPQQEKQYDFVTRLDFNLNEKNALYFRYAQGEQNTFGDIANAGLQKFPGYPSWIDTFRTPKNLAINWRFSPTGRFVNEFIFGMNKFGFKFEYPASNPAVPFVLNTVTDPDRNFAYNARSSTTWQFVDNMTFDLSPHTLKFGVNFRLGDQLDDRSSAGGQIEPQIGFGTANSDFSAWAIPTAGSSSINSTDRSLLLATINNHIGRIGSFSQGFVVERGGNPNAFAPPGTRWEYLAKYPEFDFYFQDTWKMLPNLTADLGARWEVKLSPTSEGLPVLAPAVGFTPGNAPSNALRWEERKLFENDWDNISPSVGLAWDPWSDGKTSIRTNYRLSYDRFPSQVFANFVFQSAPGNTFSYTASGIGNQNLLIRNGLPAIPPVASPEALRQPPSFSTGSIVTLDPDIQYPKSHAWFAGIQREIWWDNVLEVNYIGRRGTHLFGAYDRNQVNIFASDARCPGNFLTAFNNIRDNGSTNECLINLLFTGDPANTAGTTTFRGLTSISPLLASGTTGGSVATAALVVSQHTTGGVQTIGRAANFNNPFFFQPYPQFTGALNVLETNDLSKYHGLEFIIKRRLMNGLAYQFAYTLSESKDTRSFDPTFATANRGTAQSAANTPFDNNDRSLNYSWSDFDRRHVFQSFYTWEIPVGRGRAFGSDMNKALDWIVGGWSLSGLFNLASGRPYTFYSGRFTVSNVVSSTVNCSGCDRNMGSVSQGTITGGNQIPIWFTPEQIAQLSQPEPGEQGNTGRNYFIGPRQFSTDASLAKKFRFTERMNFELRVEARNLTNTPTYGLSDASMTFTNSSVGQINNTVLSFSRRVQFAGRLNF
jgi:hypothetical protein